MRLHHHRASCGATRALKIGAVVPFDPIAMQEAERRRDTRARISLPARVVRRGGDETIEMLDASFRGLFVRMDNPPPERQLLKLVVNLDENRALEMHAVVVRLVIDPVGRWGVGLRFFALNGQERAEWERYISSALIKRARAA